MGPAEQLLRHRLIILLVVLLATTLGFEYYLPSLLKKDFYSEIFTPGIMQTFKVIASFIYTTTSAAFVAVFVIETIRKEERGAQKAELQLQIDALKASAVESIYGRLAEPELWNLVENSILKSKIVRRNVRLTLRFEVKRQRVFEQITWDETYHNKTDREIIHKKMITTTDRNERCVLDRIEYFPEGDPVANKLVFNRDESSATTFREIAIPIPPNRGTRVRSLYSLNLGFTDRYYQNTIALLQPVIGIHIDVYKPAGYLFAIELYAGELISSHSFDFDDNESINAERLSFFSEHAIFPGTGVEYSLEKVPNKKNKD